MIVLFVGLGSIGKRHLNLLKKLDDEIEFIAYRHNENHEKNKDVKSYYKLNKALSRKPDIAFITNPTNLHIKYATKCAKEGCNLFLEKPLSHNQAGIKKLIKIVEKNNLITLMGCNMRFNPAIKKIKEILSEIKKNNIYSYRINCGSYLPNWRPNRDYRKTYSTKKEMGGGVILDLIHEIDYAYWLFGRAKKIKSLYGQISHLELDSEDFSEIILENENNIKGNIHLDYYRIKPKRKIEILTKNFIIEGNLLTGELDVIYNNKTINYKFDFTRNYMYKEQLKYFLNCVKNNQSSFNDIQEGYKVLKMALKAKGEL